MWFEGRHMWPPIRAWSLVHAAAEAAAKRQKGKYIEMSRNRLLSRPLVA